MGLFFAVEGLEGASKSTSIATIKQVFEDAGEPLSLTREPGGTPMAEELRNIVKSSWNESVSGVSELLIMFAAREQLYANVVIPALQVQKVNVLDDRCWWSSVAYQIYGREQYPLKPLIESLVQTTTGKAPFNAVLFLDVDPVVGMRRASARGALDRIEQNHIDFFYRARNGYLELARTQPNVTTVDANMSVDEVQSHVRAWAQQQVLACKFHREHNPL